MRTEEETKEIIKGLASSPDFLMALESCLERWRKVKDEEVSAVNVSFYMFCEGYLLCLNHMEVKDKLRAFKYNPMKIEE